MKTKPSEERADEAAHLDLLAEASRECFVARFKLDLALNALNRDQVAALGYASKKALRTAAINGELSQNSSSDVIQGGQANWLLTPPDSREFYCDPGVWQQLCLSIHHGTHALLIGPAGCGKTELVQLVARAAKLPLEVFHFGNSTDPRSMLMGTMHLRAGETRYCKSRFAAALETDPCVVLLDELSRGSTRDASNMLLSVLDHQGCLALDESDQAARVYVASGVRFFGTANLGAAYTGTVELDQALLDRFPVIIPLEFPPASAELSILLHQCRGLNMELAQALVSFAKEQRKLADEGEFLCHVSTRSLLACGRQLAVSIPPKEAFQFCLLNRFSAEGGAMSERARAKQLASRFIK